MSELPPVETQTWDRRPREDEAEGTRDSAADSVLRTDTVRIARAVGPGRPPVGWPTQLRRRLG